MSPNAAGYGRPLIHVVMARRAGACKCKEKCSEVCWNDMYMKWSCEVSWNQSDGTMTLFWDHVRFMSSGSAANALFVEGLQPKVRKLKKSFWTTSASTTHSTDRLQKFFQQFSNNSFRRVTQSFTEKLNHRKFENTSQKPCFEFTLFRKFLWGVSKILKLIKIS